jgi:hypothetical protein
MNDLVKRLREENELRKEDMNDIPIIWEAADEIEFLMDRDEIQSEELSKLQHILYAKELMGGRIGKEKRS